MEMGKPHQKPRGHLFHLAFTVVCFRLRPRFDQVVFSFKDAYGIHKVVFESDVLLCTRPRFREDTVGRLAQDYYGKECSMQCKEAD